MTIIDVLVYAVFVCLGLLHVLFFVAPQDSQLHRFAHRCLRLTYHLFGIAIGVALFALLVFILLASVWMPRHPV